MAIAEESVMRAVKGNAAGGGGLLLYCCDAAVERWRAVSRGVVVMCVRVVRGVVVVGRT